MKRSHPQDGDVRVRSGFLFLPFTIGKETRWLEWASWREVYVVRHSLAAGYEEWEPQAFLNPARAAAPSADLHAD